MSKTKDVMRYFLDIYDHIYNSKYIECLMITNYKINPIYLYPTKEQIIEGKTISFVVLQENSRKVEKRPHESTESNLIYDIDISKIELPQVIFELPDYGQIFPLREDILKGKPSIEEIYTGPKILVSNELIEKLNTYYTQAEISGWKLNPNTQSDMELIPLYRTLA